jgi:cation diffusion facilitator CzcD-associated flavoprotein CzcO
LPLQGKEGHESDWTDEFLSLTAIKRISATGVETEQGDYAFDMIVFATGFDAMTGPLKSMGVVGTNGATITDAWEAGPRTYLGLQVADFPNMFTVTGPVRAQTAHVAGAFLLLPTLHAVSRHQKITHLRRHAQDKHHVRI